ncbi:MAG TPA: response regulator [Candidatus Saccharimonadales bacterium]|nr:response regulator [Candidatus Saccharimonadales bacterium]
MPKLMLVEDDNNLREIYEARLQAEGYDIVTAKDGEEALAVAKAEKPELIISDVMMPKISGFEMLDILRNTDGLKNTKVIMLTALGQVDDQQRANKLGADRYLVKSQVTLEDIVREAHTLLEDDAAPATQETDSAPSPVTAPVAPAPTPVQTAPEPVATPPATPTVPVTPVAPASDPAASPADIEEVKKHSQEESATEAQTASSEQAKVEERIEDFVAGASTEAPGPEASATESSESAPTDDKIMQQAVDSLMEESAATKSNPSGTDVQATPPPPSPPGPQVSKAQSATTSQPTKDPEAPSGAQPANDNVQIAHKKVITPPNNKDKPDINTLYAIEQANEQADPASSTTPVVSDDASKPQSSGSAENNPQDPNNIAL